MIAAQALIVLMACYQALAAARKPRDLLSPVSVVAIGFAWFYVGMYYAFPEALRPQYINPTGYEILVNLALMSLIGFAIGFHLGRRRRYPARTRHSADTKRVLRFGVILLFVAFFMWSVFIEISGGFLHFYSAIHGRAGHWAQTSAYLYTWKFFLFPAAFILYLAYLNGVAKPWHNGLLLGALLYMAADAYLMGSRGGWVRLLIVLAVPRLYMKARRRISRRTMYILVPAIAALILVTPFIRNYTNLGKNHHKDVLDVAASALTSSNVLVGGIIGNELVVGTGLVTGATQTGTVNYGLDWLQPIINFAPRQLFPDKYHMPFYVDYKALITRGMGTVPAVGSAFTGVPDTYVEFSWLAPLVWTLFGWWGGLRYRAVLANSDWVNGGYLAAYLIGLVYLVTQGFAAGFYGWFYFAVAIWGINRWTRARRVAHRPRAAVQRVMGQSGEKAD